MCGRAQWRPASRNMILHFVERLWLGETRKGKRERDEREREVVREYAKERSVWFSEV